ncbi:RloB family protein [Treponema sp. R6D11]
MKQEKLFLKRKTLTRLKNNRTLRRFLIVCEGEKTEPNYFRKFPENPEVYDRIDIYGTGYNTLSLVAEAINLKLEAEKRKEPYIEVWCVFDKDDFSIDLFVHAIILAGNNQIKCAYSIEAFEIWYMLHFNFYDTALSRSQYKEKLSELLGKTYLKNDEGMYHLLQKRTSTAMQNARRLFTLQGNRSFAEQNPITTVFKLVERLLP